MLRNKVAVSIFGSVVLVAIAAWGFYSLTTQLRSDTRRIRQVYRAREQLASVLSLTKDLDRRVSDYLRSGNVSDLASYAPTLQQLQRTRARLHALMAADASQAVHLAQLEALLAAKVDAMQRAVDAKQRTGQVLASGQEREDLEAIRLLVGLMNRSERGRLRSEERMARANAAFALVVIVGAALAGFVLLFVTFYRLTREAGKRGTVERALSHSEARFHAITDSANDAIVTANARGLITYANQAAARMFLYDADSLVGQSLTMLMPEDLRDAHSQGLERFKTTGLSNLIGKTTETVGLRHGGKAFPVELSLGTWMSEDGPAFTAVIRDVTGRQEMVSTLRQTEARFRMVSELATDYAYSFRIEPNGHPVGEWVTDAFARITGYTDAEVDARGGGITVVHPDDLPIVFQRLQSLFSNQPDVSEYRIITKQGETRWVRDRGMPVWDAQQKRVIRAYGAVQDITEQRRAQEQLQSRQEELAQVLRVATVGELSAGLAHEINQPLAAIVSYAKGCSRRLRSGVVSHEDLLRVVEEIATQAIRADEIVRRLREFARKGTSSRGAVDVNVLIKTVLDLIRHETRTRRVDIDLDLTADLPRVIADGVQIEQVILSLIRNAFEAMNRSESNAARVVIRTCTQEDSIEVSVCDRGEGFGDLDPERAFEPFFSTKPNGLGVGLSISRSIIEAHGGRLWAESRNGGGVTMRFRLPLTKDADETA